MTEALSVLLFVILIGGSVVFLWAKIAESDREEAAAKKRQRERLAEYLTRQGEIASECVKEHGEAFERRIRRATTHDDYGNLQIAPLQKECVYFMNNVMAPRFEHLSEQEYERLLGFLFEWAIEVTERLDGVDESLKPERRDGIDYERTIGVLLASAGFAVRYTQLSGDQGVDVIAERGGVRIAIQCKNYVGTVGNDAVQQVYAGASFHGATRALVVAPSGFTASAMELGRTLGVRCLHHDDLLGHLASEPYETNLRLG